jgi:hypothetical protein
LPYLFSGKSWPIPNLNQHKAWIVQATCQEWHEITFGPGAQKQNVHSLLLLLDNALDHFSALEKSYITVKSFCPNGTS